MSKLTVYTQILGELRRYPAIYRPVRWITREVSRAPIRLMRSLPLEAGRGVARGFYSGSGLLRDGRLPGRIVLDAQHCSSYPADSLVKLSKLGQDENQPWPIFWFRRSDAHLIARSLALMDGENRLCAESTFSLRGDRSDPAWWYRIPGAPRLIPGNVTSVISRWGHLGYWHWLMDSLPRLALLSEFPADTKILVPSPLGGWMRWFLDELGLADRYLPTDATNLRIENYYFTAPTAMTGCHNPYAVRFLRERFLPKMAGRKDLPKRFYIVRDGYTRGVANEGAIREFFTSKGWALVAPEKLSIPDQIALFSNAEFVVAMHGSALTNLVWCQAGCRVLEFAAENFLAGAFEILAQTVGVSHGFLICPADSHFRVTVDLEALARMLRKMDA